MLKFLILYLFVFLSYSMLKSQDTINLYLFPGQGSDYRVFQDYEFPENYIINYISYLVPEKGMSLREYACSFTAEIDTTNKFVLIGYSLGGMICTELSDTLNPEKTILISSAKCRNELPGRYRFQKFFPVNKIVPKRIIKAGALVLQPLVEPDRNKNKETFKAMLKSKDPKYLKRTVNMIINWDREFCDENIIHIHGDNDSTIPLKNVNYDYLIKDGSHMMTLTRSNEINEIINEVLRESH